MTPTLPPRDQVSVLIPAAGRGERMGMGPKALLPLHGRPVVEWVVDKARLLGDEVIVACRQGSDAPDGCARVEGGATRQESVHRLVQAASKPWVLVWDAARPFGSVQLARAVLQKALQTGAAGAFLWSEVSVAVIRAERMTRMLSAASTAHLQTPQAFSRELLLQTMEQAARKRSVVQSALELVFLAGHEVGVVPGEKFNIKLTTAEDWELAQGLARRLPPDQLERGPG